MAYSISERKSLIQIDKYNIKAKDNLNRNKGQQVVLEEKIRVENQRHKEKIKKLESELYDKKYARLPMPIIVSSEYPEAQKLYDRIEGWASVIQVEPSIDIKHVYLIDGKWQEIHVGFGPKKGYQGDPRHASSDDIDWEVPNVRLEPVEVEKK
ncbi:MAG: hypothetical protein ACW99F_03400 [Candidatus Hodarchaeales archaeon]|jgi:hypothetical protein